MVCLSLFKPRETEGSKAGKREIDQEREKQRHGERERERGGVKQGRER